jgi:hypothetical protein
MDRREALKCTSAILGMSLLGADAFLLGCRENKGLNELFTKKDIELLDEIGETILPESEQSPGAKAAAIGSFMATMITDCYSKEEQKIFLAGLHEVEAASQRQYRMNFLQLSSVERFDLLSRFDKQARNTATGQPVHFFSMIKQLTVLGYFSSEPGVTKAMRYDPQPGGYNGCIKYKEGDRAWYGPLSSIG